MKLIKNLQTTNFIPRISTQSNRLNTSQANVVLQNQELIPKTKWIKDQFNRVYKRNGFNQKPCGIRLKDAVGIMASASRLIAKKQSDDVVTNMMKRKQKIANDSAFFVDFFKEVSRYIPVLEGVIEFDIYQTDDEYRSVVELISNSWDAGSENVNCEVSEGFLSVMDYGEGISQEILTEKFILPKMSGKPDVNEQIGRFGIGFYTALRHLKKEGDSVLVQTKCEDGFSAELLFYLHQGEIYFSSNKLKPESILHKKLGVKNSGTYIEIRSNHIIPFQIKKRVSKYLRYNHSKKRVHINIFLGS